MTHVTDSRQSSLSPTDAQAAGVCERCGTEPGRPYSFFVGTSSATSEGKGGYTEVHTHEEITGEETVLIGERCIAEHRRRGVRNGLVASLVAALIAIGSGAYLVLTFTGWDQEMQLLQFVGFFVAAIAVVVSLVGIVFAWDARSKPDEDHGEQVAVGLRIKDLEKRGLTAWTHTVWSNKMKAAH